MLLLSSSKVVTKKTPCHNDTMHLSTAQRKGHAMACALIARRAQEALKHHIRMGRSSYSRSVPTLPTKRTLYRMRCFSKDGICGSVANFRCGRAKYSLTVIYAAKA